MHDHIFRHGVAQKGERRGTRVDQRWPAVAVRLCKLQCESTGEKIGRCLPGPLTEIGQQSRSIASASGRSVLTRPLPLLPPPCTSLALYKRPAGRPAAASMPPPSFSRPTLASFSPCRRTSALRLFLGDVVRGSPAGHRSHAGDRVRTYVLAGSLCVRQSIALVRLSSIISRSRAAELSELCLHADAAESSRETSRQPHPADNPRASYYYGHRYIPP